MERFFRWRDVVAPLTLLLALACVYWVDSRRAPRDDSPSHGGPQDTGSLLAQRAKSPAAASPAKPKPPPATASPEAPPTQDVKPTKEPVLEEPKPTTPAPVAVAESEANQKLARTPMPDVRQIAMPYQQPKALETAKRDKHGNPEGTQFDLARDGAFEGLQIAVIHLYTGEGFNFQQPLAALGEKGFTVHRWVDDPPSPAELKKVLVDSCQLWIISDQNPRLNVEQIAVIREFFNAGRGIYIWGDNEPYYADANYVAGELFGGRLSGNLQGDRVVRGKTNGSPSGMVLDHLICTGLENLYEGVTISTIETHADLQPIVYGSAGNVVVAAYDRDGKRALLDGGFTRLFNKWDTAGTGRYVKNAAAWLVNFEGAGRCWFEPRYVEGRRFLKALEGASEGQIVKALTSTDPVERWAALVTAQKKCLRRPDEFVARLKDDDEGVRQEALKALRVMSAHDDDNPRPEAGEEPWDRVVECWENWLDLERSLMRLENAPEATIVQALASPDPLERWAAVATARKKKLRRAEEFVGLLKDTDERVRREARMTLKAVFAKDQNGLPADAIDEPWEAVVVCWQKWLERNRLLPSYQALDAEQILARFKSPDASERWTAVTAARRQRLAIHEPLIEMLRDPDEDVRQEARGSLQQLAKKSDFGPDVNATEAQIAAAVAGWNGWLVEEKERWERAKAEELRLAKALVGTNPAAARRRLEEIVRKHVGSATAEEAARLLATLSLPAEPQNSNSPRRQSGSSKEETDAAAAAKPDPDRERVAASAVLVAQRILGAHPDRLKERLKEIITEYPETRAAAEARKILESLPKPQR